MVVGSHHCGLHADSQGTLQDRINIKKWANEWFQRPLCISLVWLEEKESKDANIRVELSSKDRIAWSYVGPVDLPVDFPPNVPTMHLGIAAPLRIRDVVHEFGHALGIRHQMVHDPSEWNVEQISRDLGDSWSHSMIEHNIIHYPKSDKGHLKSSIMNCPVPSAWLKFPPAETSEGQGNPITPTTTTTHAQIETVTADDLNELQRLYPPACGP